MNDQKSIKKSEKDILFAQVRTMLGQSMRAVELSDDDLDVLLTVSIEEYSACLNEWLIQQQWTSLQNQDMDTSNLLAALTTKNLNFEKSFSYAYSKQAGQGAGGSENEVTWELKKDYFILSAYTQVYNIPSNREISEVLWVTPPQSPYANFGGAGIPGYGSFVAGVNNWSYNGIGMQSVLPSFSAYLAVQDIKTKKNIWQSESTYRITAGPKGTKNIWLYPIPGTFDQITDSTLETFGNCYGYAGSKIWYWYYDTSNTDRDACLEANNDIILLPSDVQLKNIPYNRLNDSSKSRVRRLLIAEAKSALAHMRGKYSGKILGRNADEIEMDYSYLLEQSKADKVEVYDALKEYLESLTYKNLMEIRAGISENVKIVMDNIPSIQGMFMI